MKKLRILILLMVFCCLQSIASYAQIRSKTISVGGYLGLIAPDITEKFYPLDYGITLRGFSFAWDLEIHSLSRKIGFQVLSMYNIPYAMESECDDEYCAGPPFHTFHLYGNIIFHLTPDKNIIPYLSGGPGFVYMNLEWHEKNPPNKRFAINYGGGCDFFIAPRWSARIDARFHQQELSLMNWDIKTLIHYYRYREDIGWIWYFQLLLGFRYEF